MGRRGRVFCSFATEKFSVFPRAAFSAYVISTTTIIPIFHPSPSLEQKTNLSPLPFRFAATTDTSFHTLTHSHTHNLSPNASPIIPIPHSTFPSHPSLSLISILGGPYSPRRALHPTVLIRSMVERRRREKRGVFFFFIIVHVLLDCWNWNWNWLRALGWFFCSSLAFLISWLFCSSIFLSLSLYIYSCVCEEMSIDIYIYIST